MLEPCSHSLTSWTRVLGAWGHWWGQRLCHCPAYQGPGDPKDSVNTGTALSHNPRATHITFLKCKTLPLFALGKLVLRMLNEKLFRTRTWRACCRVCQKIPVEKGRACVETIKPPFSVSFIAPLGFALNLCSVAPCLFVYIVFSNPWCHVWAVDGARWSPEVHSSLNYSVIQMHREMPTKTSGKNKWSKNF